MDMEEKEGKGKGRGGEREGKRKTDTRGKFACQYVLGALNSFQPNSFHPDYSTKMEQSVV